MPSARQARLEPLAERAIDQRVEDDAGLGLEVG